MKNIVCDGDGVATYGKISNARRCALKCKRDRACVYWTYGLDSKICYLKNACSNPIKNMNYISGYYSCLPRK